MHPVHAHWKRNAETSQIAKAVDYSASMLQEMIELSNKKLQFLFVHLKHHIQFF